MTNTANTPKTNDCPTIRRKIGKTTYIVQMCIRDSFYTLLSGVLCVLRSFILCQQKKAA